MTIDEQAFRRALRSFATGVVVVTTVDDAGNRIGMTVSSFNSVSLDPPLILWSIGRDANSYKQFMAAEHFAVNILASDQASFSDRFAKTGIDSFDGLDCGTGVGGSPILPGVSAVFECSTEHRYDGGDHTIIVGRVHEVHDFDLEPLILCRGEFLGPR